MTTIKQPSHTPGPWKWVAIDGGWDGVKQENGSLICKLVLNEPENARLIAAAPELLACLKVIVRAVKRAHLNISVKDCEAALAKATREEKE